MELRMQLVLELGVGRSVSQRLVLSSPLSTHLGASCNSFLCLPGYEVFEHPSGVLRLAARGTKLLQ